MVVLERQDHLPVIGDDPEAFTPRGIGDGGRRVPVFSSVLQIAHPERQHSFPVGADQRIGIFAVLLHTDPCVGKAEARSHVELTGDYLLPAAVDIAVGQFPARNNLAHYGPVAQELLGTVKLHGTTCRPDLSMNPHLT